MWIKDFFQKLNTPISLFFQQEAFMVVTHLYLIWNLVFFTVRYLEFGSHICAFLAISVTILGVLYAPLRTKAWYWGSLLVIHWYWVFSHYLQINNHDFLEGYLLLVFFVCSLVPQKIRGLALQKNAGFILAILFLLAAVNKYVSPDFLSGQFLLFQMHIDVRFLPAVLLFSKQAISIMYANQDQLILFKDPLVYQTYITLYQEGMGLLTMLISRFIFCLELCIGSLFLLTGSLRWTNLKHGLLFFFCVITYLFLPITSFGLLISLLGLSTLDDAALELKKAYAFLMIFMLGAYHLLKWITISCLI